MLNERKMWIPVKVVPLLATYFYIFNVCYCGTPKSDLRLPGNTAPISYNWKVRINLPTENTTENEDDPKLFTVDGCLVIVIKCLNDTNTIVLNQIQLNISSESICLDIEPETGGNGQPGRSYVFGWQTASRELMEDVLTTKCWREMRMATKVITSWWSVSSGKIAIHSPDKTQQILSLELAKTSLKYTLPIPADFSLCKKPGPNIIKAQKVVENDTTEMVHITFAQTMRKGKVYKLQLAYVAPIRSDLKGIYKSSYTDEQGKKRWLAVTQMEPTAARSALPCYDEPEYKATFTVHVQHQRNTTALGNMPESGPTRRIDENWCETSFKPTPKMSSYLLALVVSDFGYTESKVQGNVKLFLHQTTPQFRIWARKAALNNTHYAAEIGPKILVFFNKFYKVPYPLEKMDMVAVPDFAAGAMENWGLITYRETFLLYNPDDRNFQAEAKVLVTKTIAHELAHQWFGNLVTMKWWDDLWLNEGFATFASYHGGDTVQPELRLIELLGCKTTEEAKSADEKLISHPLYVKMDNIGEIMQNFDKISYQKGATMIRMIEAVMGIDNFRHGLQKYLMTYKYGNANNSNLWDSLSQVDSVTKGWDGKSLNVRKFAETWTLQKNFPVVVVKETNSTDGKITHQLSQERFLMSKNGPADEKYKDSPFNFKWYIPVSYMQAPKKTLRSRLKSANYPLIWLTLNGTEPQIQTNSDDILLLNPQNTGLYRTLYPKAMYKKITEVLINSHQELDAMTKLMLIRDAFKMAAASRINYTEVHGGKF